MTANRDELIEQAAAIIEDRAKVNTPDRWGGKVGALFSVRDIAAAVIELAEARGWRPPPTGDVIESAQDAIFDELGDDYSWALAGRAAHAVADAGLLAAPEPPVYLALDLWMALGCDSGTFDAYYARNGWAETWAALLAAVREALGETPCGVMTDGEPCVLLPHSDVSAHHGASDVGRGEPVPWVATPVQQDTKPKAVRTERIEGEHPATITYLTQEGKAQEWLSIPIPPDAETVERMAQAIAATVLAGRVWEWELLPLDEVLRYRDLARAAIRALSGEVSDEPS